MLHGRDQRWIGKKVAVLNHQLDARDVHVHDATGANVEVSDLAVAHLPIGQSDERAAGLDQGVGIFTQQAIVGRLAGQRDGVGFGLRGCSPIRQE